MKSAPEYISRHWEETCSRLTEKIAARMPPEEGVGRHEVDAPPQNLLSWLARQHNHPRYYWRDRNGAFEAAGVGEADVVLPHGNAYCFDVVSDVRQRIAVGEENLRYYGGFRFHPVGDEEGRWHDFKGFRFVAPLFEYFRIGERYRLACNVSVTQNKAMVLARLRELSRGFGAETEALPHFRGRSDLPDLDGWRLLVRDALMDMTRSRLEKVVLARQSTFHADQDIDPVMLMNRLAKKAQQVYLYCFQPAGKRAFLGASPERLYHRNGDRIASEALAGTRPRGDTLEQDRELAQALLNCDKEQREHAIVVDDIHRILSGCCSRVNVEPNPVVVKLAHCQHLHTPIKGVLKAGIEDAHLLSLLHPTPAVGGRPREQAMRWILDREPFERGIYAAPVGWIGAKAAEFCVGIRSGLVRGVTLTLYAGAGIVPGSDADAEWNEINAKMAAFLNVMMEGI